MSDIHFYSAITKRDEAKRLVSGYASTEAVDSDGEIILKSAIKEALADYMQFANIREMHSSSAVGVAKDATIDDRGLFITVKIVDNGAWEKVREGVYKGFSLGGRVRERDATNRKIIKRLSLHEISLVDRPANPEAKFNIVKFADFSNEPSDVARAFESLTPEGRAHVAIQATYRVGLWPKAVPR